MRVELLQPVVASAVGDRRHARLSYHGSSLSGLSIMGVIIRSGCGAWSIASTSNMIPKHTILANFWGLGIILIFRRGPDSIWKLDGYSLAGSPVDVVHVSPDNKTLVGALDFGGESGREFLAHRTSLRDAGSAIEPELPIHWV